MNDKRPASLTRAAFERWCVHVYGQKPTQGERCIGDDYSGFQQDEWAAFRAGWRAARRRK